MSATDEHHYAAQEIAQRNRRGIWNVPGPWQSPWLYRRNATLMASMPS
jgi:endonuclease YncB( thermonuclease family)